jgi:hypothetical protein
MSIPINQDQCDPNDPDTHALWALRALPAPIRPKVSRDLWDAGFRWNEDLQAVRFETDPSTAMLGAHAPAQPVAMKAAARDMMRKVTPDALAEVEAAEQDDSIKAQLMRRQREGLKKLQEELGHTLGDR